MLSRKKAHIASLILVLALAASAWGQQPQQEQQSSGNRSSQQPLPGSGQQMPGMQMPQPQQPPPDQQGNTQGMDHKQMPGMQMNMEETPKTFVEEITHHSTSGTSAEPNSTPIPMLMTMRGKW